MTFSQQLLATWNKNFAGPDLKQERYSRLQLVYLYPLTCETEVYKAGLIRAVCEDLGYFLFQSILISFFI